MSSVVLSVTSFKQTSVIPTQVDNTQDLLSFNKILLHLKVRKISNGNKQKVVTQQFTEDFSFQQQFSIVHSENSFHFFFPFQHLSIINYLYFLIRMLSTNNKKINPYSNIYSDVFFPLIANHFPIIQIEVLNIRGVFIVAIINI